MKYKENTIIKKNILKKFLKNKRDISKTPCFLSDIKKNLEDNLKCSICFDLLIEPRLINCGHCFCLTCIEKCILLNNKCPLCRKDINYDLIEMKSLKQSVDFIINNLEEKSIVSSYNNRLKEADDYKNLRFNKNIKKGTEIDYYYNNKGWVKAKIVDIYKKPKIYLKIKLNDPNNNNFIIISENSMKIAYKGFFTNQIQNDINYPSDDNFDNLINQIRLILQ